ncbi:hypothetical protein KJ866_01135 [Patescibacteria group bacterium]|nr:hypothetical protein [Patescibacteria group bacterium]MBU2219959.1 hypothetical protein [Patescibacteria group bacterium]MBU2264933.1 hypothetical protein [Patescibacteria group bacterium]
MRFFLLILGSILIVSLQLTWLPKLAVLTITPNLILAGVLAFAICQKEEKNFWWAMIPILLFDLLAGRPFGVFTLSACLMFFSLELLSNIFFKKNDLLALLLLAVVGVLFFEVYQFLLVEVFSIWRLIEPIKLSVFYFSVALPIKVFYNGLLSLLGLLIIRKSQLLFSHGQIFKIK